MASRWAAAGMSLLMLCLVVSVAGAQETPPTVDEDLDAALGQINSLSIRLAGGASLPVSDLGSDDFQSFEGWQGGQGLGLVASAGLRYAFTKTVFFRPEVVFRSFAPYTNPDEPVILVANSGAPTDTVSADVTRETAMGGLLLSLDYIPMSASGVTPFLTGGLGFTYMRYDDSIKIPGRAPFEPGEEAVGISAVLGVGLLIRRLELVLGASFQEPSFENGAASWYTVDLTLGFSFTVWNGG
jgi:hypothetical protein